MLGESFFLKRNEQGHYNNLVAEMRLHETQKFCNYHRMSVDLFDGLLSKIRRRIEKLYLTRDPISPGARLSLTLRYLASGDMMKSLAYDYRVSEASASCIIAETCDAIWHSLFRSKWNFPICIGALDGKHCTVQMDGATYSANIQTYSGGVGRNIAESISKIYGDVYFLTAMGNDQHGEFLKMQLPKTCKSVINIDNKFSTANCLIILDKFGDCKLVLGNMKINTRITPDFIKKHETLLVKSPLVVMDGNLSLEAMETVLKICSSNKIPVFFEPTDMRIANKPFQLRKELYSAIKFISPNLYELRAIAQHLGHQPVNQDQLSIEDMDSNYLLQEARILLNHVAENIENIILTLGKFGVIIKRKASSVETFFDSKANYISPIGSLSEGRMYRARQIDNLVNVSGAGDCFISGFISAMLCGHNEEISVNVALEAAKKSLKFKGAVPESFFDKNDICWAEIAKYSKKV